MNESTDAPFSGNVVCYCLLIVQLYIAVKCVGIPRLRYMQAEKEFGELSVHFKRLHLDFHRSDHFVVCCFAVCWFSHRTLCWIYLHTILTFVPFEPLSCIVGLRNDRMDFPIKFHENHKNPFIVGQAMVGEKILKSIFVSAHAAYTIYPLIRHCLYANDRL